MANNRRVDTDVMRTIAAFFVVLLHCASANSKVGILYNGLSRFSVPVFVLISGYFLLSSPISLGYVAKKSWKMLMLIVQWAAIYCVYNLLVGRIESPSLAEYVHYLLTEPIHLWYLWAAIGLYLFSPLLQVFHHHASRQTYQYILILLFAFGSLMKTALNSNLFPLLTTVVSQMKVPTTVGFLFLFLMGGYLRRFPLSSKQVRGLCWLGVFSTIATVALSFVLMGTSQAGLFFSFFSPFAMISGIGFFLFIQHNSSKIPGKPTLWRKLTACSLGVYLVHPLLNMLIQDFHIGIFSALPTLISIPLKTISVFALSLFFVWAFNGFKSKFFLKKPL